MQISVGVLITTPFQANILNTLAAIGKMVRLKGTIEDP